MESKLSAIGGLLSEAVPGTIGDKTTLHSYRSVLTSSGVIQGKQDVSARSIVYNIGRPGGVGTGFVDLSKTTMCIDCSFEVQDVIRTEIESRARKSNALAGGFERADFASIVATLSAGIAHYRVHGVLEQHHLSGGQDLRYVSIHSATRQIAATGHHVFVASEVDSAAHPNTIAALVAATTGAGGTLVSDLVGVDPADNKPMVPTSSDANLAAGCYDALNLLAANYRDSNAGEIFSYALTVGIHRALTVHAHTDEGGIMRDILRAADFPAPRGGLASNLPRYSGLADPLAGINGFTKFVDSIALQTAGCVALADPMCTIKGKKYPTVLASPIGKGDDSPTDDDAKSNLQEMVSSMGEFATNYSKLLGRVARLEGCGDTVVKHMVATVTGKIGTAYAHLKHKVVAPFMWIEPTGTTRVECGDMAMQQEGFGRLCSVDAPDSLPAFRGAELVGDNGLVSGWNIDWRGARRHAMLHHLMCHKLDGLANIVPRQVDSTATTLLGVGAAGRRDEQLSEKLANQRGIDEYLWGRGHSSVIAPAEFINLSAHIGVAVKHGYAVNSGLTLDLSHAPASDEMDQLITFKITAITPIGATVQGAPDKKLNRERKAANKALVAARLRGGISRSIDAMMPIKDSAPETGERWDDQEPDTELSIDVTTYKTASPVVGGGTAPGAKLKISKHNASTAAPNTGTGRMAAAARKPTMSKNVGKDAPQPT